MTRKVKSIRGVEVDFDLQDIKNKIMTAPTPDVVTQRERFIDKRRRRGSRKKVDEILAAQSVNESAVRAAIEEERRKREQEKEALPHVVLDDIVVSSPETTPAPNRGRKIVKTEG